MVKRVIKPIPGLQAIKPPLPPAWALRLLTSKSGKGVYASTDTLFKGAVFGRDSIEVAEDLIAFKQKLVKRIILTLASLQGEIFSDINEEEPGKIVHEYRTTTVDGKRLSGTSKEIYRQLSARWGGDDQSMAYYGSIDATPHFVRLVGRYCKYYGKDILSQRITLRSGHQLSLLLVLENCIDWLIKQLADSRSGLIEYCRRNPLSIENQVWKDSKEFYVHENGEIANHKAPIASIEVQGLAYDALLVGANLLPNKRERLTNAAEKLRNRTIELLWQKDRNYFALGLDFDEHGNMRIITTETANPAGLLDTFFFDGLQNKEKYISAIASTIMGRDFLTDAGIRSRGLSESGLITFWDYHGSYTTWPKETYDVAKGLARQGFPQLARELENRLLNIVLKNRQYPEFLYVDEWGRVLASSPSKTDHGATITVDGTNAPESIQAWTVSAVTAIVNSRVAAKVIGKKKMHQEQWQKDLEKSLLAQIPRVNRLINPVALSARYPTYGYRIVEKNSRHAGKVIDLSSG